MRTARVAGRYFDEILRSDVTPDLRIVPRGNLDAARLAPYPELQPTGPSTVPTGMCDAQGVVATFSISV